MKGLSVLLTLALLVLAHRLAQHLKQAGVLPAEDQPRSSQTVLPSTANIGLFVAPNQSLTI